MRRGGDEIRPAASAWACGFYGEEAAAGLFRRDEQNHALMPCCRTADNVIILSAVLTDAHDGARRRPPAAPLVLWLTDAARRRGAAVWQRDRTVANE